MINKDKLAMAYVLENMLESDRLESQSMLPGYDLTREFADLELHPGWHVMDAGCGTGLVSRHLLQVEPTLRIDACDQSAIRLKQASRLFTDSELRSIRFVESALERLSTQDSAYDLVVCRYLFEHLQDPDAVMRELRRVLKPGGMIYIVNFDGVLINLSHRNDRLRELMGRIMTGLPMDLMIGRKIPQILAHHGFSEIQWKPEVVFFEGISLAGEIEQTRQRLGFSRPLAARILSSMDLALEFERLYLEEMAKPGNVLFYNKFVIQARR